MRVSHGIARQAIALFFPMGDEARGVGENQKFIPARSFFGIRRAQFGVAFGISHVDGTVGKFYINGAMVTYSMGKTVSNVIILVAWLLC